MTEAEVLALSSPFEWVKAREIHFMISDAMIALKPRTCHMLMLRYWNGMTLKEVGDKVGLSKERTRQVLIQGMRNIRHKMKSINPEMYEDLRYGDG